MDLTPSTVDIMDIKTMYELLQNDLAPDKVILLKQWNEEQNHFVSMLKLSDDIYYYYDSLASPPPKEYKNLKQTIYFNTLKEQKDTENNCGPRSVLSLNY